jgi:hypothetical protein
MTLSLKNRASRPAYLDSLLPKQRSDKLRCPWVPHEVKLIDITGNCRLRTFYTALLPRSKKLFLRLHGPG